MVQSTSQPTICLFKSILSATILTLTLIPILLFFTSAELGWIVLASFLWFIGTVPIFYPFIRFVYPHLLSRVSFYLLTSILIIISEWLNVTIITLLLPYDYLYYSLFNATLVEVSFWGTLYIIVNNIFINHLFLSSNVNFYTEESLF